MVSNMMPGPEPEEPGNCKDCEGSGASNCDRCDGDGKAHGSDRPFESSGTGDYPGPCPACKGTGIVEQGCQKCGGTGDIEYEPYGDEVI